MNPILTTLNLFSYTVILTGNSPFPQANGSRVMPGFEYTHQHSFERTGDHDLTKLAMTLSIDALSKVWDNDEDEHWNNL
jgi:hypothetical protein